MAKGYDRQGSYDLFSNKKANTLSCPPYTRKDIKNMNEEMSNETGTGSAKKGNQKLGNFP